MNRILVIKLSALGDVVLALGPMQAIRDHHKDAHISVLTTRPFVDLLSVARVANEILIDKRPGPFDIGGWLNVRRMLRRGGFDRVYDLQTSDRSSRYRSLFWPGPYPEWSGIAEGCSHPHANPDRDAMHTVDRQAEQLHMAGIDTVPLPDLSRIDADVTKFALPDRYAVLVPGGAAHRPEKRWPVAHYAALAARLQADGITPVVVGGAYEHDLAREIAKAAPDTVRLTAETTLLQLVAVIRGAALAVGNDSGPMHIAALLGVRSVVLYSHASDPALCGQRGADVTLLRERSAEDIPLAGVLDAVGLGA